MPDTLYELIAELTPENDWPKPELLTAIMARGDEIVKPLCQMLNDPECDGWSLHYAANLLALHGSREAIPALANTFRLFDTDFLESTSEALSAFGEAAIDPALDAASDAKANWYQRAMAINAAVEAAGNDAALKERVSARLRAMLEDFVARAKSLTDEEIQVASALVCDLSGMVDPAARDLIETAFAAEVVDESVTDRKDVQRAYGHAYDNLRRNFNPRKWFEDYPASYQRHLEQEAKWAKREQRQKEKQRYSVPAKPIAAPKLGRNDLCWCGSGKKYKHCHLRSDTSGK